MLLALLGPAVGAGGYWLERVEEEKNRLAPLSFLVHERAAALGIEAFLGYELVVGFILIARTWARQRELGRRDELLISVIESVSEGVIACDPSGRVVVANDAARRLSGYRHERRVPLDEFPSEFGVHDPVTGRLLSAEELPLVRALRGERVDETELLVRNPRVQGERWMSVTGAPVRDGEGRAIAGVAVFRDITERKHSEALAQRLASAVEQTADAVLITDRTGTIEYVNPSFERMAGYTSAEALGQTPRLLKSGRQDESYYGALWSTILAGRPFAATVVNRKKDGARFIASQTITPLRDGRTGTITHFVSVMRDLSERLTLEQQGAELSLAASIQQRLFPAAPPEIPGYEIAGAFTPALATCGDYFDFIALPDGRLLFVVADVCGHGLGPALIMASTRAYLRSLVHSGMALAGVVTEVNRLLRDDLDEQHFVTMLVGVLDTGSGALIWANMGHPAGFVLDARGTVRAELRSTGTPLGLFAGLTCKLGAPTVLEVGETVLMMTDGVIEAVSPDGVEQGAAAALDVLRESPLAPAREVVERIIAATRAHRHGESPEDDVTVVVIRRTAAQERSDRDQPAA